jgi:hypothetical protein
MTLGVLNAYTTPDVSAPNTCPAALVIPATVLPGVGKLHSFVPFAAFRA